MSPSTATASPYQEAGKLLHEILTKHISLKTASFGTNIPTSTSSSQGNNHTKTCSKSAYALVSNTLVQKSILDKVLNHNHGKLRTLINWDTIQNKALTYILLYELLFGKYHSIRGGGYLKRMILQHASLFQMTRDCIVSNQDTSGVTIKSSLMTDQGRIFHFPRYVRVNTMKVSTTSEIVTLLKQELSTIHPSSSTVCNIYADPIVPDLLVLSPYNAIDWTHHTLVTSGKIILQDKSSCFSALALIHGRKRRIPQQGNNNNDDDDTDGKNDESFIGDFIDACAAPGNKCQHLATLIASINEKNSFKTKKNIKVRSSRIYALDKSSTRIQILKQRMNTFFNSESSSNHHHHHRQQQQQSVDVIPIHEDFLKLNPLDSKYEHVRGILLDPSCSGSGIVNTPDRHFDDDLDANEKDKKEQRLQSLANFQVLALKHAMSFQQVQTIVYSTCSIHEEENEQVIYRAIEEMNLTIPQDDKKWVIVSPYALRHWHRRGKQATILNGHNNNKGMITPDEATAMIRVDGSDGDETNGFFVCYLERKYLGHCYKEPTLMEDNDDKSLLPTLPNGVDGWYKGQFSIPVGIETHVADLNSSSCHEDNIKTTNSVLEKKDKSVRKRQKRLDWKRKQKQLRLERLKVRGTV